MRLLLALIAALACALPAAAAQRAVYLPGQPGEKPLVIEVADNGDARVGPEGDDSQYGLMLGDTFYLVTKKEGRTQVARISDLAAAIDTVMPPIFKDIFTRAFSGTPPAGTTITASPKGAQQVGGVTGSTWLITSKDMDDGKPAELVLSTDPKLQPVGRALRGFLEAGMVPAAALIGPAASDMIQEIRAVFAKGTPLKLADRFALREVGTVTLAPERLALPGKPATVAELAAEMKAQNPQ